MLMGKWASVGLLLCGKRGAKLAQTWWELAAFEARKFRTELVANWEMGKFGPNSDRPICGLGRVATFMLLLLAHLFCLPTFAADSPPRPQPACKIRRASIRARDGSPKRHSREAPLLLAEHGRHTLAARKLSLQPKARSLTTRPARSINSPLISIGPSWLISPFGH